MNKYLIAIFSWGGKPVPIETIQNVVKEHAPDWLRFAPNCWILWTPEPTITWGDRLNRTIGEENSVLVFELDMSKFYGWVRPIPKEWLERKR